MKEFNVKEFAEILGKIFGAENVKVWEDGCPKKTNIEPKKVVKEELPKEVESFTYAGYEARVDKDKNGNRVGINLIFCVPGLTMDQISITEENNVVTVSSEQEVKFFGKLHQKTKLKNIYDIDKAKAKLSNGILAIYFPVSKKAVSNVRKIKID